MKLLDRIPRLPDRCLISREYILIFTKSPCESHTPPLVLAARELVFGYSGTSDMNAAFNRGEIEVTQTCRESEVRLNPEWAAGYTTPLFYTKVESPWITAGKAQGKWGRVDSYVNIARDRLDATDVQIAGINALLDISASTRVFAMPSQTPPRSSLRFARPLPKSSAATPSWRTWTLVDTTSD